MILKRVFLINLLLLSISISMIAQENVEFKSSNFSGKRSQLRHAKKQIRKGDAVLRDSRAYKDALELYMKAQEFNPDNAELNYKIGKCFIHSANKYKALSYFEKAINLDRDVADVIELYLGKAHQLHYNFDEAVSHYNAYIARLGKGDTKTKKKAKKYITECRYGKELVQDTVDVKIRNLGDKVNSIYPDYNPLVVADDSRLIFTSRREYTGNRQDPMDNGYYEDVYYCKKKNGQWDKADRFKRPINTAYHDAVVGLSNDGQTMYVYNGANGGDIYKSRQKGRHWSKPENLGENINTPHHESKASLSYDGKTLFFVSDNQELSMGGRDILYSEKDRNGNWGPPKNLSKQLNTEYDEEGVFMHPDGRTLFFSSQGHNSMGGFDIFRTVKQKNGTWATPENLGFPINTPGDEVFFVVSASGEHAYFSSVRPEGLGDDDIYEIVYPARDTVDQAGDNKVLMTLVTGFVKDAESLDPLEAEIEIVDNVKNKIVTTVASNEATGKFLVSLPSGKNYGLSVNKEGYMFHSENFNISDTTDYQQITKEILLQPIEVGTKIVLENIFFDFNKASLRSESHAELNRMVRIMEKNPGMEVEISGHTDNKGSMEYNMNLSLNRAKNVVEYLVDNGIDAKRLTYQGYAFKDPIATNDTEEGRQLNRRVEFRVIRND